MIHPNGNIDYQYLYQIFLQKQISFMVSSPSLLYAIFEFIQENNFNSNQITIRSISAAGKDFIF